MPDMDKEKSCCFFGHRRIDETEELKNRLCGIVENLIVNEKVDTFFFGSKSQFDDLCHKVVTELKEKYSHIKRIYVRSAFQHIPDWYEDSLLKHYEGTYFPEYMENAGKASYVERNQEMIIHSKFCVVYYDENYLPPRRKNSRRDLFDYQPKSGTAVAYDYAIKKKKEIINVYNSGLLYHPNNTWDLRLFNIRIRDIIITSFANKVSFYAKNTENTLLYDILYFKIFLVEPKEVD